MEQELAAPESVLQPAHRRRVSLLSGLMHFGLLLVCASAVYSLQPPTFTLRHWLSYLIPALVVLAGALFTRGRFAFLTTGKLFTAFTAALVFSLAADPQLASLPGVGEKLPEWALTLYPGLATLGLLIAVVCGFWYLSTLDGYLAHGHPPPFRWALKAAVLLILALGLVTVLTLRRFYEINTATVVLLVANVIQYGLLLRLMLATSGRIGVGAGPALYLAATILLAFGRNLLAVGLSGGEGP